MSNIEYKAELSSEVQTKEVEKIIDRTCNKMVIAIRIELCKVICTVHAGEAKYILTKRVTDVIEKGGELYVGKILEDTRERTRFEVRVGDACTPTEAQTIIWNALNVSPDVRSTIRFDHIGESCSVKMVNAGAFFNTAQLDILKKKGISLEKIEPITNQIQPDTPIIVDQSTQVDIFKDR